MANEWKSTEWGELATLEYGKAARDYRDSGGRYRVYGTNGPIGWCDKPLCEFPSIIIGRKGAYRGVHFSPDPFFVIDTAFYLNPTTEFDMRWAYYELLTHDINSMDSGSAIPSTSRDAFYNMPVLVPPLPTQRAIAHILGTLDDKIECNRRLNRTLEGIVRALFKSWFIDFDPVIDNALAAGKPLPDDLAARAALRQQATAEYAKPLPDDLRALFPAEFTHTDTMGWIPKGWEIAPLSTLARLNPHAWTARNAPKRVRYIDLANTKNGSINEVVEYAFDTAPSRARRILYSGDTVFGTVRPGNRSFAYIHEEGLTGSTGFAVLHPLREAYREFVYLATTRDEIVDLFAHLADGAAYPAVRAEVVIEQVHAMPPTQIIEAFHHSVAAEIVSIGQRSAQNQKLSALRDALLPKLLTGEVTVPVAATLTAEADR